MKVLIVGANFNNKGAQSMLFISVDEIRKLNPEAQIYFTSGEKYPEELYRFSRVYASIDAQEIALHNRFSQKMFCFLKDTIKKIVGRNDNLWEYNNLNKLMPDINLIIDVSGFNLGSKWSIEYHEAFLNNIRLAKKYNIPIILMPQSFGPFDYTPEKEHLISEIADLLPYVKIIFAREREGYQMLIDTFHLTNVELSTDLVLQNKGINIENIYVNLQSINVPEVSSGSVGIVPNKQCFTHGDKHKIFRIYKSIISKLIEQKKEVYIFRHSSEDMDACKEIYDLCTDDHVHLLENDFSCLEYDAFVQNFDFIVCSRYHGIVHAYKNCVPSILLGWAVKYKELAELLGQGRYNFDITNEDLKVSDVVVAIENMCREHKAESEIINTNLKPIQKDNCFNRAFGVLLK